MAYSQTELAPQVPALKEQTTILSPSQDKSKKTQRHGIAWVMGSFLFCPCHLPLTLGLLAAIFGGTALGAVLVHYSILAGVIITSIWAAGTWYGFRKLRATTACAIPTRR
jgi:Fe2+ transport system protein B